MILTEFEGDGKDIFDRRLVPAARAERRLATSERETASERRL